MTDQTAGERQELMVTREFDAPRERVWQAWTDPEMVQRWYGPEGFTAPSIKIDLKVGGKYIWAMRGPAGTPMDRVMYIAGVYQEIVPNEKLAVAEYMSDENGNAMQSPGGPAQMTYQVRFEEAGKGRTKLSIVYPKPATDAEYQAMLKGGMLEGWNSSLNKLAHSLG
ncbi:MAG TPA: SRPBCC domain-containing protein [Anaerolineae bacterium]|nr:SRPBCC domain-containing protein [Anaerolineae bacterium]